MKLRILKLGGSLLDWELLDARLRRWIDDQPPARNLVVVGGGPLVQLIRRRDCQQPLGDARCHWLAIAAMRATGRQFAQRFAEADTTHDLFAAPTTDTRRLTVLDVGPFLRDIEPTCIGRRLSWDWDVTSDSIAARIAQVMAADELVLLKSTLPIDGGDWTAAARAGVVDRAFPEAVVGVQIAQCVDLRRAPAPSWVPKKIAAAGQLGAAIPA